MTRAFSLALFLAVITTAFGQEAPRTLPPLVTTNGSAEIKVSPDLADLSFSVTVRDSDFAKARKLQAARAAKVLAALHDEGIENKDIQTSQVLFSTEYGSNKSGETARINFYEFSQTFNCTLHDISKVPDVTFSVVNSGATGVQHAVLRASNIRKYQDQARVQAIGAAKEKALALAAALNCEIGKPYSIAENSIGEGYRSNSNVVSAAGVFTNPQFETVFPNVYSATFIAGMIKVSVSVTVSFEVK
jgi:uncharacterized protein